MGRLAVRAAWDWTDFDIVHINEVKGGAVTAAHLLEFDSVHGRWRRSIEATDGAISIDGKRLGFTEHQQPGDVPWNELDVDIVVECSGKFVTAASLTAVF